MDAKNALAVAYEKRKQVSNIVTLELTEFRNGREEQAKISEDERSKLSFLAFSIAGAVLTFSPESLENNLVVIGLAILIANAFLFGYVAQASQKRLNMKNFEDAMDEELNAVDKYYESYDEMLKSYDKDGNLSPQKYSDHQEEFVKFLEWHSARKPRYAKKSKIAVGHYYLAFYGLGLIALGSGLLLKYNLHAEFFRLPL